MPAGEVRKLRADSATVQDFLEKLDEASVAAQSNQDVANARDNSRYRYRIESLIFELSDAGGSWTRYEVPTRNISRTGACILLGHFVYPNTECRVHLVSLYNHSQPVRGKVVRCRYIPGSGRMHEVGIHFATPIDVALFFRGASYTRVLIADDDPNVLRTAERILTSMNLDVVTANHGLEAAEQVAQYPFDLAILDLDMPVMDGVDAVRELRSRGFARPIVGLMHGSDDAIKERCLNAGFTVSIPKPVNREALSTTIQSLRIEPIVSSLLKKSSLAPQIDEFVRELPERIREMEVAFIEKDFDGIGRVAHVIAAGGSMNGFDALSKAGEPLERACTEKAAAATIREKLNELSRIALAVRPVSCLEHSPKSAKPKA